MCMFVGYPSHHAPAVYEMWDPTTKGVHITHDIRWLQRMYYTLVGIPFASTSPFEAGESVETDASNDEDDNDIEK